MQGIGSEETGQTIRRGAAVPSHPDRVLPGPDSRRSLPACPELECVRRRLPPRLLAEAEQRALAIGVGADRVLIADRAVAEDSYVVALAAALRVAYEPLAHVPRAACPLLDAQLADADRHGLLPLHVHDELVWVVAPRMLSARRLFELVGVSPRLAPRIRLTSSRNLRSFVLRHGTPALGARAAEELREKRPDLSAAPRGGARWRWFAALAALAGVTFAFPHTSAHVASAALAIVFLAWTALRVIGAATAWRRVPPLHAHSDELPVYTVIVALYREAAAVGDLVAALAALDYPREKLDIKLVLEGDDVETRAALDAIDLDPHVEIVLAPDAGPRTKPKALNVALALARGTFTAVFDAEDRPAPDQLHRALDVFLTHDWRTACVQARLTIDNTRDSCLTRLFTAEYAGLFDVLLPGLARRRLPLPLGGSSNHFRTDTLRAIGGWDAYNVTEDADLGMRLARFGYRAAVIDSTTYEEAPARIGAWLKQRTRWFKGWMQTWAVHMRAPVALARSLGFAGFMTFQLLVGGTVLAALVHPLFVGALGYGFATGRLVLGAPDLVTGIFMALYGGTLAAGYLTSAALGLIGLARRRLLAQAWVLLLMPIHWLLLSLAAWRALYQLVRDPYRWEKTEHGLAATSRLEADARRFGGGARSNGAGRRPRPRAAA